MKKVPGAFIFLFVLFLVFSSDVVVSGKETSFGTIELRYATIYPPPPSIPGQMAQYFASLIQKYSGGKVSVLVYPGGALVAPADIFDAVLKGVVDMGISAPSYTPGRFPVLKGMDLPYPIASAYVGTQVADEFWRNFTPKEVEDFHLLFSGLPGPYVIASRVKAVKSPRDLKGLTIRATGGAAEWAKICGATPVNIPSGEMFESFTKGILDAALIPMEMAKGFRLVERVKYWTIAPYTPGVVHYHVMNKRRWVELPSWAQNAIEKASTEMREVAAKTWYYAHIDGELYAKQNGAQVIIVGETEGREWQVMSDPVRKAFIDDCKKKGLPGEQYVRFVDERIEFWNRRAPSAESIIQWAKGVYK
ncbi:MAG: TRAP transporter substrate-binding protein DctP [Candidatus Bathyarchaeia archaeon]